MRLETVKNLEELLRSGLLEVNVRKNDTIKAMGVIFRLLEIAKNSTFTKDIIKKSVYVLVEELDFENASILRFVPEENALKLEAAAGVMDILKEDKQNEINLDLSFKKGEGIAWKVFETQEAIFINDVTLEDDSVFRKMKSKVTIKTIACLPLKTFGVLNLSTSYVKEISQQRRRELILLAQIISGLLETTAMKERLDKSHEYLQQVVEDRTKELQNANIEISQTLVQLENIISTAPQGICIIDESGKIQKLNPSLLRLTGFSKEDLHGKDPAILFPAQDSYTELRMQQLRQGVTNLTETLIIRKNGSVFDAEVFLHSLGTQDGGKIQQTMLIIHDISEQKEAAEKLMVAEKHKALMVIAGGIAHKFNNLLTSILGNVQLLERTIDDTRSQKRLKNIEHSVMDGAQAVRRLQAFTRVGEGTCPVKNAVVPASAIEEVVEFTKPIWQDEALKKGLVINISTSINDCDKIAMAEADFKEVLTTLIINAIEAMPHGGDIHIKLYQRGDSAILEVSDTGTGMSEDIKRRIFDPFFTTKGVTASGLGLSVAYAAIKAAKGSIEVDSVVGKGSTFKTKLPVVMVSESNNPIKAVSKEHLDIMVVDDEEDIAEVIASMLEAEGHNITCFSEPNDAVAALETKHFDLVITDLGMPGITGWDIAQKAKASQVKPCVILLTGWGAEFEGQDLRLKGVDAVMSKPCKIERMKELIQQLLPN